jgi:hypothetical protein
MPWPLVLFFHTSKAKGRLGEQMTDMSISTDSERPAVWIFALQPAPQDAIGSILLGLEEEGIPAEVEELPGGSAEILAKQAADGSRLNVGIGVDGTERHVVLHHRDLPDETPLFTLTAEEYHATHMRRLGGNAARLVKGNPLIFQNDAGGHAEPEEAVHPQHTQSADMNQLDQDQLEELILAVVTEILENQQK